MLSFSVFFLKDSSVLTEAFNMEANILSVKSWLCSAATYKVMPSTELLLHFSFLVAFSLSVPDVFLMG